MSTTNEKLAAEQVLHAYAEVLNKADIALISSFYAFDGLFMAQGFKTLAKKDLDAAGSKFLKVGNFKINYAIQNVTVENEFAFIDATARTTITRRGGEEISDNSRDFFVLRKDGTDWKIYRYLFNKIRN
ncbi:nuclear transport factor 2 family protein [Mucilaginibacter sp. Bleaf8]|uniref:YybH family protein n=1 Tax=Mucilaginibacter sp. Bleaf8 TaxID=2834430 RepID=UPI001BCEFCD7|nr:nuclear transport factor 2 family protein [Mucilaginibacter sp. Bleaf8]MBS7565470.1 nuclear transport factor 2 family protein [Mucilaginibacter sp. Bleaf8]